jgi:hypothetical protein
MCGGGTAYAVGAGTDCRMPGGGEDGGAVYAGVAVAIGGGTKIVGSPGGGAAYPSKSSAAFRTKVRRPHLTAEV